MYENLNKLDKVFLPLHGDYGGHIGTSKRTTEKSYKPIKDINNRKT